MFNSRTTPRMAMIVNPDSGRGRSARMARMVADLLRSQGVELMVVHTAKRGDAATLALQLCQDEFARPGIVIACGGDGCVQETAHALASLRPLLGDNCPALGIAPSGRCNDFACALGLGRRPLEAVETLLTGIKRQVDLGRIDGRHFCTIATVGVDAEITSYVDQSRNGLRGTLAYLYGAVRVLADYEAPNICLEGDFGRMEGPMLVASSANTSCYGGAISIAPQAVPNDGLLDLCVIRNVSRRRMATLLPQIVLGAHASQPEVSMLRTRHLTVSASRPLAIWADGEPVALSPTTIEVVPRAIDVVVPRRSPLCNNH